MLDLKSCIEKGLIRKIPRSTEQARLSFEKAAELLEEAKANLEEDRYNSAVLIAYASILNLCRALLFKDGYREKSHYCVARFLEVNYGDELGSATIGLLDAFRETRHEVQYSTTHSATKSEAEEIMKFAEEFLEKVEKLLEGKMP